MVLGRSTDDVKVDIDLGREAEAQYATKISRRQVRNLRNFMSKIHCMVDYIYIDELEAPLSSYIDFTDEFKVL